MRVLFVAADPMEFRGLVGRGEAGSPSRAPAEFAREARFAGHEALLVADGMGWKRAARAVAAGDAFRPEVIVSTGFCGALDERLAIADVIAAAAVVGDGSEYQARPVGGRTGII